MQQRLFMGGKGEMQPTKEQKVKKAVLTFLAKIFFLSCVSGLVSGVIMLWDYVR